MKRYLCAALAAALLMPSLWAVRALAQDDDAPPPEQSDKQPDMGGKQADRMKERLGLTDEQAGKLKDALKAHGDAVKPLNEQLRDGMKKLVGQIKEKAPDADVQATLDSLKQARQAQIAENDKFRDSLESFLSATQRAKMLIGMERRMRRGGRGPGGRGMRGPRNGGGDHGAPPDSGDGDSSH